MGIPSALHVKARRESRRTRSTQGHVPAAHQDLASLTQTLSHALLQQYESLAQTVVAHELQLAVSLVPVLHTE